MPSNSYVCMAVAPSIPLAKPSPQQGERANTRLKQVNRGSMPVSFGLDHRPPPSPSAANAPTAAPPSLQAQYQNLSLNLGKLDELGRQFGIHLFEHHVAAPLPQGATSAPLFQSLYESYAPAPAPQGISAAVVHTLEDAIDHLPTSPRAELDHLHLASSTSTGPKMSDNDDHMDPAAIADEGAGIGQSPPHSPTAIVYPCPELGFLKPSHGAFPASTDSRQVAFDLGSCSTQTLGAAPESLGSYNAKKATLHYAANPNHPQGITLVLGGQTNPLELLPLTLLDSGANTSIVTRQYCQSHNIPYEPCPLRLNTASGTTSPVLGKVTLPAQVVFAINTPEEAYTPLTLFVVEGSTPAVFELLLSTEVLRILGAYVDPLHEVLVYRPRWQSNGDADSYAMLPVSITTPRNSATTMLATVSLHLAESNRVRGTNPLLSS